MRLRILLAVLVLVLSSLACGGTATRQPLVLYPTNTPDATQTPIFVEREVQVTTVVEQTTIVEVTNTPNSGRLCVSALVAVHLRPSPSDQNYPILALPNGAELTDLGGRDGKWLFAQYGDKTGWVHSDYLGVCG
jgi:hypothetical protein